MINAFSSNVFTVNLKAFSKHRGIFSWKLSPDHSIEYNHGKIYPWGYQFRAFKDCIMFSISSCSMAWGIDNYLKC